MSAVDQKLTDELTALGLIHLADRAAKGMYSDFRSPLPTPKVALVEALYHAAAKEARKAEHRAAILALRKRVMEGDFDG